MQGYESRLQALQEEHRTEADELTAHISEQRATIERLQAEVMGPELHTFVLKDPRVPGAVIDGVGKFIDFKKYLGIAAETGARGGEAHGRGTTGDAGQYPVGE